MTGRGPQFQFRVARRLHLQQVVVASIAQLEPGNVVRTTFSASWLKKHDTDFTAVTAGLGLNHKDEGNHASFFTEATRHAGMNSVYGRRS